MSYIKKCSAKVISQRMLAKEIYSMWIGFPNGADVSGHASPGQFISLYCADGSRLLPRPISICEIDVKINAIRIVYRLTGRGTAEFSMLESGDSIEVMGPLGNGYEILDGTALLIGGGIGIPPLLELAKSLRGDVYAALGYTGGPLFLKDDFKPYAKTFIATEDGSAGVKGNVLDAIAAAGIEANVIYACGPVPMLRGVKAFAKEKKIRAQVSLEERMACGIGACLGCVCASKEKDGHSNVKNKRVCRDGPVFYAEDVEF